MRIKMLACLALAVCIFAAPVSAKDKIRLRICS